MLSTEEKWAGVLVCDSGEHGCYPGHTARNEECPICEQRDRAFRQKIRRMGNTIEIPVTHGQVMRFSIPGRRR